MGIIIATILKLKGVASSALGRIGFVKRNIWLALRLPVIRANSTRGVTIRGLDRADEPRLRDLYRRLNSGAEINLPKRVLYRFFGARLLFVAQRESDGVIVGFNMFYFNVRDVRELTVHEGFIGVVPEASGKGVASAMRACAIKHFGEAGISGISSRVSVANEASMTSATNMGFVPVERYFDPLSNRERCYLVRPLK